MSTFDALVAEGAAVDVSTWGAGFLAGRHHEEPLPWRYPELVRPHLAGADALLDMDTGDGSRLLDLAPLPPHRRVRELAAGRPGPRATLRHHRVDAPQWHLALARTQVEAAGLTVLDSGEATVRMWWSDVGALVAYLRSVPWDVPDFDVERYRGRLRELHDTGRLATGFSAFWLSARRAS